MEHLINKLASKIEAQRLRTQRLNKEFGKVKIDEVKIEQVIGGMRDIKSLVTDISYLDPYEGIRYRGKTLPEVMEMLPKPAGKEYPYVESLYFFLLTGEIPNAEETKEIVDEFKKRRKVPQYVIDIINAAPKDSHPMVLFSMAILAMQKESEFYKSYMKGFDKMNAWKPMLEDSLNLLAKLGTIAAYIYRMKYLNGKNIKEDENQDFAGNFAHLMGIADPYDEVSRMYFILHADHESGNVSAHTSHLVASALSDAYYSTSAMLGGLAGPLHGLANQEVLHWIQNVRKKMNNVVPTEEQMKQFVLDTLKAGQVIPGFGHAVLRKTDPRYSVQREFALKHMKDDELFVYVDMLFKVVPPILTEQGKVKNPWPNVDSHSGVIQWHYGLKEYDFYTVLFGIGRAFGTLANITWDRALGYALERPKSVTTDMLEEWAGIKK